MGKYNSIAVFYGSDSSEWEVACRSGEFTASRIDENEYDVYEILARFGRWQLVAYRKKNSMRVIFPEGSRPEVDKTDCSVRVLGEKVKFDYVYIMQHGRPGENGLLQGYLEMIGVPYSGCDSFVSAVAFDKFACKNYLRDVDFVKCAPDAFVRKGADLEAFAETVNARLLYPVFVKPTDGGSSFGITKVSRPEDLVPAVQFAFSEGPMVLVEQGVQALPLIEIVTENDYFDYDAKYNGHSQEVCPAPVTDEVRELVQDTTRRIYRQLGCNGVVRVDFILGEDGLYFLEVNTIPGMTSASLVPRMVRTAGMDMTTFLSIIIENS